MILTEFFAIRVRSSEFIEPASFRLGPSRRWTDSPRISGQRREPEEILILDILLQYTDVLVMWDPTAASRDFLQKRVHLGTVQDVRNRLAL